MKIRMAAPATAMARLVRLSPVTSSPRNCDAQPPAEKRAEDPDDDVADQAKAPRSHEHAGEPAGDEPQDEPNKYRHDTLHAS